MNGLITVDYAMCIGMITEHDIFKYNNDTYIIIKYNQKIILLKVIRISQC